MQQIITFIEEERASHGEQGNRLTSPAHWFFCPCRSSRSPSDAGCPIDDQLQPGLWQSPLCVWPHQPRVMKSAQISLHWPVNWLRHSGPNRWPWYKHPQFTQTQIFKSMLTLPFVYNGYIRIFALCTMFPHFLTKLFPSPFKFFRNCRFLGEIPFVYNVPIFWINRFKGIVHL